MREQETKVHENLERRKQQQRKRSKENNYENERGKKKTRDIAKVVCGMTIV